MSLMMHEYLLFASAAVMMLPDSSCKLARVQVRHFPLPLPGAIHLLLVAFSY